MNCTFTLIALMCLGQAEKGVDPAVAAARARQDRAGTVVLEFKQTDVDQPGSKEANPKVPEKETSSESKNRVVLDGSKMRFENNHPMWDLISGKLCKSPRVEVDDGITGKNYFPQGVAGDSQPIGRVHASDGRMELALSVLNPILFAFRGADEKRCVYPISSFKPTGKSEPIAGSPCREYTLHQGDCIVTAWLDPAEDYTVRRLTIEQKGKRVHQLDAEHRHQDEGWVPASWTIKEFNKAGDLLTTTQVEVSLLRFGDPVPASTFELTFPPGTFVADMKDKKYYEVEPADSLTKSKPGDQNGIGQPMQVPGEASLFQNKWLLATIAVLAVAVLILASKKVGSSRLK